MYHRTILNDLSPTSRQYCEYWINIGFILADIIDVLQNNIENDLSPTSRQYCEYWINIGFILADFIDVITEQY